MGTHLGVSGMVPRMGFGSSWGVRDDSLVRFGNPSSWGVRGCPRDGIWELPGCQEWSPDWNLGTHPGVSGMILDWDFGASEVSRMLLRLNFGNPTFWSVQDPPEPPGQSLYRLSAPSPPAEPREGQEGAGNAPSPIPRARNRR